jgi:hypothetical protein
VPSGACPARHPLKFGKLILHDSSAALRVL